MFKGGMLARRFNLTLLQRKSFFYGVCIWVRLLIAYSAYKYRNERWFLPLVAVVSGLVVFFDSTKKSDDDSVWWSRTFHYYVAATVFLAAIGQMLFGQFRKLPIVSLLLLIDVSYGFLDSFNSFQ